MLGLRTNQGIDSALLESHIGKVEAMQDFVREKTLTLTVDGRVVATQKGLHILNRIIEELMI